MKRIFFSKASEFRKWLEKNHDNEKELLAGFYKVGSGKPSMTWSESVDEALCFGWIDGVRKGVDSESYTIRFTPRRNNSIWSKINLKKIEDLKKSGKLMAAGQKVFENRNPAKVNIYSFEREEASFKKDYESKFRKNKAAWKYFTGQAPSYQRVMKHWVMSAKQDATQSSRLDKLINASEKKIRVL